MPNIAKALEQAEKLIESSIEVVRNDAGALDQEGRHDVACAHDQAATFLEAAITMLEKAKDRMDDHTNYTANDNESED